MLINEYMCYRHKPLSSHNAIARAFLLCLCINRCTCSVYFAEEISKLAFPAAASSSVFGALSQVCAIENCVIGQGFDLFWPDWLNWWVWPRVPAFEIHILLSPKPWNSLKIFGIMAVTPQTPKRHHNRGAAEVVVTFESLWCHSHDRKQGFNFYSIMAPQN